MQDNQKKAVQEQKAPDNETMDNQVMGMVHEGMVRNPHSTGYLIEAEAAKRMFRATKREKAVQAKAAELRRLDAIREEERARHQVLARLAVSLGGGILVVAYAIGAAEGLMAPWYAALLSIPNLLAVAAVLVSKFKDRNEVLE